MSQTMLYYRAHIATDVLLYPDQLDGDVQTYLLENLRETIEGTVIDKGYIVKVNSILWRGVGKIDMSNFNTNVIVPVKYDCYLCAPREDMEIIMQVSNVSIKRLIIATNGPVEAAIQSRNVNPAKFSVRNNVVIRNSDEKAIDVGDYIKVIVDNPSYIKGFKNIITTAKLVDLASAEEIANFNKESKLVFGDDDDEMI